MLSAIVKFGLPALLGVVGESYFARTAFPAFYAPSSLGVLPRGYGASILVNVVVSGIVLQTLATQVSIARNKYKEKAAKDGDIDAEARFSYPKLYAEGFSRHAKEFNCIQRGHQQALETYPVFLAASLVASIRFPLLSTAAGLLWSYARFKYAQGYATGEPSKRYDNFLSRGVWIALIIQLVGAIGSALAIADLI
eukprot:gene13033-14297_t